MENTLPMLEELQEKYKRNSKLSKVDSQNAIELICNMGLIEENFEDIMPFLATFPQEISSNSIINIFNKLDESNKAKIIGLISSSKHFNKYSGDIRKLDLAKNLLKSYPNFSMALIMNLSEKITETGNKQAPSSLATKFAEDFIMDSSIFSFALDEYISESQFSSFSLFVVGGLIESKVDKNTLTKVLFWLAKVNQKSSISKQIKNKIEKDVKLWDEDLQHLLFKIGLVTRVVDPNKQASEVKTSYLSNNKNDFKEKSEDKHFQSNNHDQKDNNKPSSIFEKVKHYVNELEEVLDKVNQEKVNLNAKVFKSKSKIEFLEKKFEETQTLLQKIEKEKTHLINQNGEYKEKIKELEERIFMKEKAFEENKNQLIDMSEVESQYLVHEFKNKLKKKLRIEYMDFKEVDDEEMTIPLGENMRVQLRNLFSILEREGISFKGGSNK
jgi:hypothetical protein